MIWRLAVPVVALAAGLLFATSAVTSHGTDLRSSGDGSLPDLVGAAQHSVQQAQARAQRLQNEITAETDLAARSDSQLSAAQRRGVTGEQAAGLVAMKGVGVQVTLDDSHRSVPAGIDANDLVVHQSDLQSMVNALWAGGAEAMSIAGQRVIATSAVRCVGSTLLLNGQVYSPAFVIVAIGPQQAMRAALDASPGVRLYRQAAAELGLTYQVRSSSSAQVPAYDGPIVSHSAKVLRK